MDTTRFDRRLVALALVSALAGGLIEGVIHLGLQRVGILDNSWYPIIWIAAVFNGLLTGLVGAAVAAAVPRFRNTQRARAVAIFIVLLAACLPWLALGLKNWVAPYTVVLLTLGVVMVLARRANRDQDATLRLAQRLLRPAIVVTLAAIVLIEGSTWATERVRTARLPTAEASSPNVLLVVIDALRADHLSAYKYGRRTSPAIDRLAAEGVVFENAVSTSSYTLPTHASILSGLYPSEHRVSWDTSHQATAYPVLPEALLARGYRTGAFSANTFYFSREHRFGRGFLHFEDFFHSLADMAWRTAYGGIATRIRPRLGLMDLPGRKQATDTNRAVRRWVRRDPERPFFVMINYMDVHDPYLPPEPFRRRFSNRPAPGGRLNFQFDVPESLPPEELQSEIDAYDGAIAFVDDGLGTLVADLQQINPARDLIVVVTSDHGEEFGEHGGFLHARHLYREAIHVPLIIRAPGRAPAGMRVAQPVTNAALPATILAMVGGDGARFPGPALHHLWESTDAAESWPLPLSELEHRPWAPGNDPVNKGSIRSLMSTPWHYVDQDGTEPQLFDWTMDSKEANDLAGRPDLRHVLDNFAAHMASWFRQIDKNSMSKTQ